MANRTGVVKFYKSVGAAQFSLLPPRFNNEGFLDKEGAILLEVAKGDGNKDNPTWDWKNTKISFAISITDICSLLDSNPSKHRIFHEHLETPKTMEIKPGTGNYEGTYTLALSSGKGEARQSVMVPLSNGEHAALMRLLVYAMPKLVAW